MSKTISKESATEKITNIVALGLHHGLHFAIRHEAWRNTIVITGVDNANHLKALVPAFDLKLDSRQTPYVELVITYE